MATGAGSITIARHGEPAISRRVLLTAPEYGAFWARYESTGLKSGQSAPDHLVQAARGADVVIASVRPRSVESAQMLIGEAGFRRDARLIEAPLPHPPFPALVRMSPRLWGFFARVWWWSFNHHRGQETRVQAVMRAREVAADLSGLAGQGQNVLVVAHGFFNAMLGSELKRLGWRKTWGWGWKYWSTRRYERR